MITFIDNYRYQHIRKNDPNDVAKGIVNKTVKALFEKIKKVTRQVQCKSAVTITFYGNSMKDMGYRIDGDPEDQQRIQEEIKRKIGM